MNTRKQHKQIGCGRKLLVLALLAAFGPVHAEDDEVATLTSPNVTSVTAGAGLVSGSEASRSIFGQYTGWSDHDSALLLDFQYVKRDAAGFWIEAEGRNLGQDDRELRYMLEKQGDWKYSVSYSELVRRDPRTINTGLQGIGSTNPTVNALGAIGTGADGNLSLERKNTLLEVSKWITPHLSVEASFRNEDKEGARLSGIGGYCSNAISPICTGATSTVGALFFLPEPVKSKTQQFEVKLNYFGDRFSVTGGYYGSFYNNLNTGMVPFGIAGALPGAPQLAANLSLPMALPPDNQAHQFYVSGTFALQPTTRVTFKYAYTEATQDQNFGILGAGNLDGKLITNFAQAGLTTRLSPKLSVNANVRFEDREDKTKLGNYRIDSVGTLYTNSLNSSTKVNSKAEASYQFSSVYRGTLGVDYEYINRERPISTTFIPDTSMAALRQRTNELGYRAEVRRSMSDTVNAAASYRHSKRDGYRWVGLGGGTGFPFLNNDVASTLGGTFPVTLMNRDRDSVKLMADWMPTSALSLQFWLENGKDSYVGPTAAGVHSNDNYSLNVDAALQLSDDWKLTGYVSTGEQILRMRQGLGYIADLENLTTTFGLGAVGRVNAKLEIGGDLALVEDTNHYKLGMTTGAPVADLPNATYRATTLKLYGKYALDNASDIRVDMVQQWAKFNEWTWSNFAYTDNTTVGLNPTQDVTYMGVRYTYRFK